MIVDEKINFGTDGFRGIIGANFNYENIRRIAQGLSDWLAYKGMKNEKLKVFIEYDRRFLSNKFAKEFATVLINNNVETHLSKTPLTTPMVSYLTTTEYTFGVMITASHNPYLYNGVKFKYQGRSLVPQITAEIELYIQKNIRSHISRIPRKPIIEVDKRKDYVEYLHKKFNIKELLKNLQGKIVFDLMYGSSAEIFDILFEGFKNIIAINKKNDPLFGEIGSPEPVEKKLGKLKEEVKRNKAICGFAIDGDGDRFALIDENGNYLTPTKVSPLILNYLVEHKKMYGKVVQAVSLGYLPYRIAKEKNMIFEFTPVGFKYIADRLVENDTIFGAEESGGYSWKGNIPERDGFVTSLIFIEMLSKLKKNISQLYKEIEQKYGKSYFIREDLNVHKLNYSKFAYSMKIKSKLPKTIINKEIREIITIDGIKVILENDWWFLIRPSGTEPLLRIYVETENEKSSKELLKIVKELSVCVL